MNNDGEIKFHQDHTVADPPLPIHLVELRAWRNRLHQWKLLGVYPNGNGYGNVSHRLPTQDGALHFVITGTRTGREAFLWQNAFTTVTAFDVSKNLVVSQGQVSASSESLTHGVIYQADPSARYVFHAHDPTIWSARHSLGLLETAADVPYGTPEMADQVLRLFSETDVASRRVFAMAGHEDGLVSFGQTAVEAGSILRKLLTRASGL